jgi:hypothetical protein
MEAVCGGVGEVAQICVLYPLETIKVRTPQRELRVHQFLKVRAHSRVPHSGKGRVGTAASHSKQHRQFSMCIL